MSFPVSFPRAGLALLLASGAAVLAIAPARGAGILRDIYSTAPGNPVFHLATANDHEGGAQAIARSTHTARSQPYGLRLKFLPGIARNVVGLRFITDAHQPNPMNLIADRATTTLEFWINPKESPAAKDLVVSLVSDSGGKVESRLPLSRYLRPEDHVDRWAFVSIPLKAFPDAGFVHDRETGTDKPAAFDWSRVVGLNFSCDTTASAYYDPSVDDVRLYSNLD